MFIALIYLFNGLVSLFLIERYIEHLPMCMKYVIGFRDIVSVCSLQGNLVFDCNLIYAIDAVHGGRNNAAGIARTFAARI